MSDKKDTGVYQLDNGCWAYRYKINTDGTRLALLHTHMHILCNQMGHAVTIHTSAS
ncbi:hypothetical protein [Frisingicoccus sp.]|uniref:hypothetical protein n=1 Tax=Frisingicoccus sp. TaxID=1918627 RepID=UPI002A8133EF|nr:hypothetical protein [Frisingicoccus sp.]MCI7129908.1 hypothetical protein [Lachnospiraceae bacterium]MDD7178308.1 hypothetical protein [bacterium]MDY4922664.1 hypothetical protein [Frisingicoccus sp.]MDY5516933.1 hypothetical protein [Lachnospiraceae bacterium]